MTEKSDNQEEVQPTTTPKIVPLLSMFELERMAERFRNKTQVPKRDLLTAAEEASLFETYRNGFGQACELAREILFLANAGMARRYAVAHYNRLIAQGRGTIVDRDDLYTEGMYGVHKSIEGFDHTRGWRFSTYAVPKVMREIELGEQRARRGDADCSTDDILSGNGTFSGESRDGDWETTGIDCKVDPDWDAGAVEEIVEHKEWLSRLLSLVTQLPQDVQEVLIWRCGLEGDWRGRKGDLRPWEEVARMAGRKSEECKQMFNEAARLIRSKGLLPSEATPDLPPGLFDDEIEVD